MGKPSVTSVPGHPHKHKFGLLGCIVVILGCILGAGIFAAPQDVMTLTGSPGTTLIMWAAAGLLALNGAFCFVEIGCTFPISGGDYSYLYEFFGNYPAFLFQMSHSIVVCPLIVAIMAQVVSKNLITANFHDCKEQEVSTNMFWATRTFDIALIMVFAYLNSKSPKLTERVQEYLMLLNILAIIFLMGCGVVYMSMHGMVLTEKDFAPTLPSSYPSEGVFVVVNAFYIASYSYFGYSYINYIVEELDNPLRNLPIGAAISIPMLIVLNVFINFCYMGTLTLSDMKESITIVDSMYRAAVSHSVAKSTAWIPTVIVAIAVSGGMSSSILTTSRISYTGARNGDFPPVFKLVNSSNGSPVISVIFLSFMGTLYLFIPVSILILVATYLDNLFNCVCIMGLIYNRIKHPEVKRPFKIPLIFHLIFVGAYTFLLIAPLALTNESNWEDNIYLIAGCGIVFILGTPLYFIFIRRKRTWPWLIHTNNALMKTSQKLLLLVTEDDEEEKEVAPTATPINTAATIVVAEATSSSDKAKAE